MDNRNLKPEFEDSDEAGFTHVEVERMDGEPPANDGGFVFMQSQTPADLPRPPTISAWICLILAWLFLGSTIPFTVFIGLPLNFAALVLALMCLARGANLTGLLVLVLGTVGSIIVYIAAWILLVGKAAATAGMP